MGMKSILILKLGSTLPELARTHGDFDDWIRLRLREASQATTVIDAQTELRLPDPRHFAGVILTGSHSMVTDREPWSERAAAWIPGAVSAEVPLLGICYGHQLLAHAMGGEVGVNPRGPEYGTIPVHLHERARHDPLFAGMPATILVQASHDQSVLRLPPGAVGLAASAHDPHQAFVMGTRAWGVQFHPEFDARVVRVYVWECVDNLRQGGQDPLRLLETAADTPHSESLLARFGSLVREAC